jgi:WD repeat-containing protein 34
MEPILTLEPNAGYLYSASWSPVRPVVIATVTGNGKLVIYDLNKSQTAPFLQLEASYDKSPAFALQFNPKQ